MSRRSIKPTIDRDTYDPKACGAQCGSCPLNAKGALPVRPRGTVGKNPSLSIITDYPTEYEVRHGRYLPTRASRFIDDTINQNQVEDVYYSTALACRPPKGTTDDELRDAISCCAPRLQSELNTLEKHGAGGASNSTWSILLGDVAWRAGTEGLSSSPEAWRGSPVKTRWSGIKAIATWDPGYLHTKKGRRYALVWTRHVERALMLSDGRLKDFKWPESIVNEDEAQETTLEKLALSAECGAEISVDIETRGLGLDSPISCIGFAAEGAACCVQLPTKFDSLVRRILKSGVMVGQNISSFDRQVLSRAGYELTPQYEDTLLAASILDPQLPKNLGALVSSEFHAEAHKAAFKADKETGVMSGMWNSTDPEVERERRIYCLRDAYTTLLVWRRQKERLKEYGADLYQQLKQLDVIALSMRATGCEWDFEAAKELEAKYAEQRERVRKQLKKGAGLLGLKEFNPGSTKQLANLFYNKCKVTPEIRTPEGKPSTSDDALTQILKCDNPTAVEFARKVAEYREADKALGTYIVGLRPEKGTRVHGVWRAHTAVSGRWSCTEVPLQTLSSEMRRLIKATPGKLMCEADLPSAEVRTVMLFAQDKEMVALLNDGGDLYSTCATEMFGRTVSKKENKKLRQLGKLIILASNYGAAPETVWAQIIKQEMEDDDGKFKRVMEIFPQLNVKQVEVLQKGYFRKVPSIPRWWATEEAASAKRGYYLSPFDGRRIEFYGPVDRNLMANFPNQATVAWWMNRALLEVRAELLPTDILLTYVHDSLCIESLPENIDRTQRLLHNKMEGDISYGKLTVKMSPVESKCGPNLAVVK